MTKAEAYDKAWRLGARGDFSLVDQIYHPDYSSFDYRTGIEANIEDDKMIVATLQEDLVQGPREAMYESDSFVCIEGYARQNLGNNVFEYFITLTAIHYKNQRIIKQKTAGNRVDYDPSEYFSWNWEDYE